MSQVRLCMLCRTEVATKFVITFESNLTVVSIFEMAVTSKICNIHIWHSANIHFQCVAAYTPNSIKIREFKVKNSALEYWFEMEWLKEKSPSFYLCISLTHLPHTLCRCSILMPLPFLIYFAVLMLDFLLLSMIGVQVISWSIVLCSTGKQMKPSADNSWMTQGTGTW
jgi:hypothetical protein